ncbi:helicase-exonuclease AddAB subunit AddB [Paenibacillus sp. GCM10027627]|uniref:helicase-exonuclease AddAB subunit AddB n=1 Tax=unclassified Paenibacillus TaxID=185978 RepID=UPI00363EF80A
MALRFVIGRSGSGKTSLCQSEIQEQMEKEPLGPPLIMLVPEQTTFQSEYALFRSRGLRGTLRVQTLSFRRLAYWVMQETGGTAMVPIGETGKHMLLYKIVHRLSSKLELYQNGAEQPGFIERLAELLTEWKRYGMDSSRMKELAADAEGDRTGLLRRKLTDLAAISEAMEFDLKDKYIDDEDYLKGLAGGFKDCKSMNGARIWVDGFYGFTPAEYEALGALLAGSAEVTVALTLDRPFVLGEKPHELDLFHQTAETYGKLLQLAEAHDVPVLETVNLNGQQLPRFRDSAMLSHLEKHFGGKRIPLMASSSAANRAGSGIVLETAANRRAEVEAVARHILEKVRKDGLRWREISVLVRNAEDYSDYLSLVFHDYGIPYFVDQKEKALHHPLVEFIRSALETVLHGWRYDAVFRCIKTEMLFPLDGSIPRDWFDRLENYALAAGIDGWKWLDRNSWKPQAVVSLEDESGEESPVSASARREYEMAIETRKVIVSALEKFGESLKAAGNVREMCEALYRLLETAEAADRLELWSRADMEAGHARRARTHRQLWDNVMDLLDQMVELAGSEKMKPELFAGMVEAGLEGLKLASVPPALDQVLVGSMDRTRAVNIRACYVLGANDGVLPMRIKEDGILTEAEREELGADGIELAPNVKRQLLDERFMIYNAFTTPSETLWISWPLADEEGKTLLPSEIIRSVQFLFPALVVQEGNPEPTIDMAESQQRLYIAHPVKGLSHLVTALRSWQQGGVIPAFWWDLYNWYAELPEWEHRLGPLTGSLIYHNQERNLPRALAKELYGERMSVSVSRMERFVSCPFQHFAIHGLKLRERKLYRLEAPDVGQLFHAALSKLAGNIGAHWGKMSQQEVKEAASKTVDDIAPKLQSQILLSSGRFQFIARKLKEIVTQAAVILGEHARRAQFQPVATELDFGPGGTLPALVLPLENGAEMQVVGRIDRVDAAQTEEGLLLRVLDYKSSVTMLRLEEVVHGLSLQMLTYLDVLVTHAEGWLGQPAAPAGVLYFHVHNPMLALPNRMTSQEAESLVLKRYKTKGLLSASAEVAKLMDADLETGHSDLLPVALKKDGSFYSSSSVVSNEQWTTLRRSVRKRIGNIGSSIQEGDVSIRPYRLGNKSPCQYCDYKALCQFDPLFEGNEYNRLGKTSKEDVWRQLEGE